MNVIEYIRKIIQALERNENDITLIYAIEYGIYYIDIISSWNNTQINNLRKVIPSSTNQFHLIKKTSQKKYNPNSNYDYDAICLTRSNKIDNFSIYIRPAKFNYDNHVIDPDPNAIEYELTSLNSLEKIIRNISLLG